MKYLSWIFFPLHRLVVVLFFAIFLAACGSGGGGGGSNSNANASGALQPVTYLGNGNTNEAVITGANAKILAAFAMSDFGPGSAGQIIGANIQTAPVSGKPILVRIANTLQKSLASVKLNPVNVSGVSIYDIGTVECDPGSGPSGGTATVNIAIDSAGDFTGSIRYSACNEIGEGALSGNIAVEGHILDTGDLDSVTSAGTFAFTQGAISNTFTGSLTTKYTYDSSNPFFLVGTGFSITATVDIRNDNANGEYIRLNNFEVKDTFGDTYDDFSYTGIMCHWKEGCVQVATPTPFRDNFVDPGPFPGQLEITGALTPFGNSKLRLIGIDNTSYSLEWDTLGTGTYSTPPLLQLWSEFRL